MKSGLIIFQNPHKPTLDIRSDLSIEEGAIVCHEARLVGPVKVVSGAVIHPAAVIEAEWPIVLSSNVVVEERARVLNPFKNHVKFCVLLRSLSHI